MNNRRYTFFLTGRKPGYLKSRAILVFIFLIAGYLPQVQSQIGQTMYFMDKLPQASLLNPAYQHSHNFHLGLPLISSFNTNAGTNFVSFSDIIFKHPRYDSLITFMHPDANIGDFTSRLKENNIIAPDLHINLLSFGFRAKRSFISFNISERASMRASLPGDFIKLGLEGNAQFSGKSADFSGFKAEMNYFREYAVGYALEFSPQLNLGVRAKLLYGKANISFSDTDISLYTDPDTYNMRLQSKFTVNLSMPMTLTRDENGDIDDVRMHFDDNDYSPLDFIMNTGNKGFALDFGATYRIIPPVTLYASITDLGFINWKQDVYNFSMDGDFEFDGLDLSPAFDYANDSNPGDNLLDSLKGLFSIGDTSESFTLGLPTRIFLGGTYEVNHLVNFGLLSRSEIYQKRFEQAVTLSANYNFRRWFSASASYSLMNNSYNNFGMGLALRGAGFQLFMLTDNLNTTFQPHKTRNVNIWFGLNLVFGHNKKVVPESEVIGY